MACKYNVDEVLNHLSRKKNIRLYNGSLDVSNADIIGNKTLGKLDFLSKQGYPINIDSIDKYKKKHGFVNEGKEKKFSISKKSLEPTSNGKQVLKLIIGEIPSFWNLGPVDRTVFTKSKYEKEQLKLAKHKKL